MHNITLKFTPDINNIGNKKLLAIKNLVIVTEIAVLNGPLFFFSGSCAFLDIYKPKASDNVSDIEIANIPAIIANFDIVPDLSPIINPKVVIVPDIIPK